MKYPILYEENEKVFTHLGLGPLTNTLKAHVVEERNGAFYLDMEVLVDDIKYPLLQEDRIIKADAGHILKDQRFRIKKIVPKEDNKAEVYAEHVSYLAQELSLKPETGATGTADSAIKTWKGNIIDKNDFTVDSDITTVSSTTWKINEVKNAREALGGVKGSILDRWGGEYRFDNYHISLLKKRGKTAETLLAYGRNITDFEQERNIKNTYNAVYPFVVYREDDKNDDAIFTLKDYIVDSKYVANYPNRKALPVDFSSEFKDGEKPTAEKLKRLAEQYIVNNKIGVPTVSIKLKFIDLSKTLDYEELAPLEQLNLCDDVRIVYPKLGVDTVSKVIRVVWDHLTEKYYELEIGQKRLTLSNIIREQETAINEIHTETNHALLAANGKNTNFYGLYGESGLGEPTATRIDDTWFKPNGEHTEMYRWDGLVWKFIFSTAPDNSIIEKIEELEEISKEAQEKADQAIEDADFSKIEVGKIKEEFNNVQIEVDKIGEISMDASNKSNQALIEAEASRQTANEAKEQSFNSEQLANSAKQDAITAIQKGDQNSTQITTLEGQQKLTNTKVEGNTANILNLQANSEKLSLSIGKVQADVDGINVGDGNDFPDSERERSNLKREFLNVKEWDMAPLIDEYGVDREYTLSVDIKSVKNGTIRVYSQNGAGTRYTISEYVVNVTDEYQRFYFVFKPEKSDMNETKATLAFYGTYGTGMFPIVRKGMFTIGNVRKEWQISARDLTSKSEFATFEASYKGFQTDVKSDLTGLHSQQTQMAGQISSIVGTQESFINKKNLIPKWLVGGIVWATGIDYDIDNRIRTDFISVDAESDYTISLDGKTDSLCVFQYDKDFKILTDSVYNSAVRNSLKTLKLTRYVKLLRLNTTNINSKFQLEKGASVSPFSPFISTVSQSEVIQLSDQITQTVNKVETVDGKVTSQQSQITQLSDQINSKVNKTDFDSLTGTVTQQGTEIAQLSDRITQTVTKIESVDGKVVAQQTQINQLTDEISSTVTKIETIDGKVVAQQTQIKQLDDKIQLVVKEQTELNTKYSKIEQTTDALRSEVVEMGQAVADIGTYVNYLINADDFSDNLPYTIGMSGPPKVSEVGLQGTVMEKGKLKFVQASSLGWYVITDDDSDIGEEQEYTFSGKFDKWSLNCKILVFLDNVINTTKDLNATQDFSVTFKVPKGKKTRVEIRTNGYSLQHSFFSKMKLNKGPKRVENTVDTASLNARITTVEQTSAGLKTEVKDLNQKTTGMDARITTVEQTSTGLKTEVALIKDDQIVQSSQITQLSDNINLRVEKNKVISQINISPETIRLESKLIHLSGKSLIDDAVIKSAMIESMTANKLTAGIIDAAQITVINMNANNITTGVLKAIDITGSLITGSNFTTVGDNTTVTINEGVISINSNTTGNIAKFGLNTTYSDGLFLQIPKGIYMTGIRPDTSGFFSIDFKNNKMQAYLPPVVHGVTAISTGSTSRTAEFHLDASDRAGVTGYNGVSFGERNSSGTTDQLGTWNTRELKILTPTIIENSLSVRGAKNAIHESSQGWIATPAYETAESYLGDIGTATTDENGNVVIFIDELFSEIINTEEHEYHVFLQSYRYESPVFVLSRNEKYFTVKSKLPQTVFAYELKAKRRGYETDRLKKMEE